MRLPITLKLVVLFTSLLLFILALTTFRFSRLAYLKIEGELGSILKHITATAVLKIDEKEHRVIKENNHDQKKEFKKIKKYLSQIQKANNLELETIYTFQVHPKTHKLTFGVMLVEPSFVNHTYNPPKENQPIFDKVIKEGKPTYTKVYGDAHGHWISGLAPIKNEAGEVTGILEADYKVEKFNKEVTETIKKIVLGSLILIINSIIIVIFMASKFTNPIKSIQKEARKITKGNYDSTKLNIKNKDEIGDLAKDFEKMNVSLKERFHLQKYISKDTVDMIKKMISHEVDERGEKKELAILFSDIRGFTKFSERRDPEKVIAMLNLYLGAQSDVIKKYNGRIDKYVGDEIIALFEGSNNSERAIQAATEMQEVVQKINQKQKEILQIGIGIAKGDVFMGSIGGNDLKDYTAIGSYMNLASRLCSGASAKEVIITERIRNEVLNNQNLREKFIFKSLEAIQYKGFSNSIFTYSTKKIYS